MHHKEWMKAGFSLRAARLLEAAGCANLREAKLLGRAAFIGRGAGKKTRQELQARIGWPAERPTDVVIEAIRLSIDDAQEAVEIAADVLSSLRRNGLRITVRQ